MYVSFRFRALIPVLCVFCGLIIQLHFNNWLNGSLLCMVIAAVLGLVDSELKTLKLRLSIVASLIFNAGLMLAALAWANHNSATKLVHIAIIATFTIVSFTFASFTYFLSQPLQPVHQKQL